MQIRVGFWIKLGHIYGAVFFGLFFLVLFNLVLDKPIIILYIKTANDSVTDSVNKNGKYDFN